MRRLLSIVLTAVFLLPLVFPLIARGEMGEAGVPACCRRNGKHKCMMSATERTMLAAEEAKLGPGWRKQPERCPYCPATPVKLHSERSASLPPRDYFASVVSEAAVAAQAECAARIAHDRSRQKRGPPQNL